MQQPKRNKSPNLRTESDRLDSPFTSKDSSNSSSNSHIDVSPPKCSLCRIDLPDMISFCESINGFHQQFLCTDCGNDLEASDSETNQIACSSRTTTIESLTICFNEPLNKNSFDEQDDQEGGELTSSNAIGRFKCQICPKTFETQKQRRLHHKSAHLNPETGKYVCPFCSHEVAILNNLEVHMISHHTGSFSNTCHVCGKGFARLAFLEKHMRSHRSDRDYVCPICCKRFKHKHSLIQHDLIHTDKKPYGCELCERRFRDSSDLRRHRYSHGIGEKRFQCVVCEKRFYDAKWLRQHLKVHQKN